MPHVLLINPNTSVATTDMMVEIAASALPAGFTVRGCTATVGVPMIVNEAELNASEPEVLRNWASAAMPFDAVIVSAFGDPGMAAIRNRTDMPVVGIFEASVLEAAQGGRRFGIATVTPQLAQMIENGIGRLGLAHLYTGIRLTEGAPRELAKDMNRLALSLDRAAKLCIENDGAEAVIIGGGPLGLAAARLEARLHLPIIAPIAAAARQLVALLRVPGDSTD